MPDVSYKYAYLIGNLLILLPIWLILFRRRTDLRKEIIYVSVFGGIAGPTSQIFYLRDYWQPQLFNGARIGLEDFLFGFFIAGITTCIYEEVVGCRFIKRKYKKPLWIFQMLPLIIIVLSAMYFMVFILAMSSIYASITLFVILSAIIIYHRKDLIIDALVSGLLVGVMMVFGYLILLRFFPMLFQKFWIMKNLVGINLLNIPIEEVLWAFTFGLFLGPYWEFLNGYKLKG